MKRVIGIDPGVKVGLVDIDFSQPSRPWPLHIASWQEADALVLWWEMLATLDEPAADAAPLKPIVAIERVEKVHGHPRMGSGYATGLVRAAWLGGEMAGLARAHGLDVVTVTREEWRSALAGGPCATDAAVKAMVRLRVPAWPKRSSDHERDAAGVAIWAAIARARQGAAS